MRGFTLIEILVGLAVVAVLGIAGYINYRTFSQEQVMDDAVSKAQSLLRTAQTNATASLKCETVASTEWMVVFTNTTTLQLQCKRLDNLQEKTIKQLILTNNVQIDSIGTLSCTALFPMTIGFNTLSGKVSFSDPNPRRICIERLNEITVKIKHTLSPNLLKSITITNGGGINATN